MSLLKEMLLLSPKMENIQSSMDLDSYLLSQDLSPVDVQPVSPDVLAKGAEDLLFDGTFLSTVCTTEDTKFKELYQELDQLHQPEQGSLLDDFLDGPVDLGDFLNTLCESSKSEPEDDQMPSALADLSSFDVDSFLGLCHDTMEPESSDSGIASPAVTVSPYLDFVAINPAEYTSPEPSPVDYTSTVIEEQPGMYVELTSEYAPSSPELPVSSRGSPRDMFTTSQDCSGLILVKSEPCVSPMLSKSPGARFEPYKRLATKTSRCESKKERKRLQNQQAAIRYRQKKKHESDTLQDQAAYLREENADLDDKVHGLEKEIKYMKDLLLEVYKAKGLFKEAKKLERALRD